jgi:hypothetical protein
MELTLLVQIALLTLTLNGITVNQIFKIRLLAIANRLRVWDTYCIRKSFIVNITVLRLVSIKRDLKSAPTGSLIKEQK